MKMSMTSSDELAMLSRQNGWQALSLRGRLGALMTRASRFTVVVDIVSFSDRAC
jgi:hypothetical protein